MQDISTFYNYNNRSLVIALFH